MGTLENRRKLTAVRGMGAALVGFAGWIVLYVVFGLIEPNIFTTNNMLNLLRSMAKYLLVGVGQGVILITGNIDLSIGSVVAMSAMISATMMSHGTAAIVAVCAAIVCCLAVGVINGLLVGKFKLPPFIATLGTMFCARGVAYLANGNRNTDAIVTGLGKEAGDAFQNFFYYGKTLGIYNAFWIAFVIFAVVFFLMNKTRTGRHIYAIGSNEEATRLSGINVDNWKVAVYTLSGFFIGMSGLFYAAAYTTITPGTGNGQEMNGITGVIIGGTSMSGGSGTMVGTLIGVFIMSVLKNGLSSCGLQAPWQTFLTGVVVIGAVLLDIARTKAANRVKKG